MFEVLGWNDECDFDSSFSAMCDLPVQGEWGGGGGFGFLSLRLLLMTVGLNGTAVH